MKKKNIFFECQRQKESEEDLEIVAWEKNKLERNQKPTKKTNKYKARAKSYGEEMIKK